MSDKPKTQTVDSLGFLVYFDLLTPQRLGRILEIINKYMEQSKMTYQSMFLNMLDDIRATSSKCPRCGKVATNLDEVAFTNKIGHCSSCDRVQDDVNEMLARIN